MLFLMTMLRYQQRVHLKLFSFSWTFFKKLLTFGFRLNRGGGKIDFQRHRNFGITFSSSCTRGVRPYLFRASTNFLIHFGYICYSTYSPWYGLKFRLIAWNCDFLCHFKPWFLWKPQPLCKTGSFEIYKVSSESSGKDIYAYLSVLNEIYFLCKKNTFYMIYLKYKSLGLNKTLDRRSRWSWAKQSTWRVSAPNLTFLCTWLRSPQR